MKRAARSHALRAESRRAARAGGSSRGAPRPVAARDALDARRRAFERYFDRAIRGRCGAPGTLGRAIRYAALSPGKRLRPLLVLTACEAVGGSWRTALPAAAAVECVHAFSLVHDDLPAMDDDDYRRGRLATHRKFGEAIGILAGDALVAFGFEELTRLESAGVPAPRVIAASRLLAHASGGAQLIGGQALDIAAERRPAGRAMVRAIHERKTGALFGASLALGALAGGAPPREVRALERAGRALGLAFQIHDDLLNAGATLARLGKRAGTDAARGKATYPRAVGAERARRDMARLLGRVRAQIARRGAHAAHLAQLIEAVAARER